LTIERIGCRKKTVGSKEELGIGPVPAPTPWLTVVQRRRPRGTRHHRTDRRQIGAAHHLTSSGTAITPHGPPYRVSRRRQNTLIRTAGVGVAEELTEVCNEGRAGS